MLDTLSGCCSGLKSSFLIFSLNSGEEIHYIIADNHVGHSVEKKKQLRRTHLNGIHIVSNNDELCLLALH